MEAVWIALIVFSFALIALIVFLVRFPDEVRELLRRTRSIELKPTGIAWRSYAQAVVAKEERQPSREETEPLLARISGGRILWVDDSPINNRLEAKALRARGVEIDFATTNDEAVEYAIAESYDLVISDIGRKAPETETAGLELPARFGRGGEPPIVYYTGHAEAPQTPSGHPVFDTPSALFEHIAAQLEME